jgi:CRP-like cAMP-binding protein
VSQCKHIDLSGNKILANLPQELADRLKPHLSLVTLKLKDVLCRPQEPVKYLYFPIQSVISSLIGLSDGESVEVGMVGNEGVVPIEAVLGAKTVRSLTVVQVSDGALRITAKAFLEEFGRGGVLTGRIHRYLNHFLGQVAQTAACNRVHTLDKRLCRWLLIARSKINRDDFPITHEFLGTMLGAPRSEVTFAAAKLRKLGLISYRPGRMTVLDLEGLESAACECYSTVAGYA